MNVNDNKWEERNEKASPRILDSDTVEAEVPVKVGIDDSFCDARTLSILTFVGNENKNSVQWLKTISLAETQGLLQ